MAPAEFRGVSRGAINLVTKFYKRAIVADGRGRLLDLGCGKASLYGYYRDLIDEATLVD